MRAKCANPLCPHDFHQGEGRFHRLRLEGGKIRNYWLCGHCCQIFTLVFDEKGVTLRFAREELQAPPAAARAAAA